MNPIVLYRYALSGHAHRAELFLSLLGLPVRLVDVDLRARAQKSPEFLRKNPFGQVPVIEDGDVTLSLVPAAQGADVGASLLIAF